MIIIITIIIIIVIIIIIIIITTYKCNCRQYCFGLMGLVSAVLMLGWGEATWSGKTIPTRPSRVLECQRPRSNCRQYCFGLTGLIGAVPVLGWGDELVRMRNVNGNDSSR